ncbi:RNA polymerase sigma factor [uncultured Roseobacter sp.]|uniref:RNA polymerase sigma factor n=1 Tax=uncultured Roseobacter sp. TaxID=114847 RepID=UPI002619F3F9|nr:RNA polymerase sigma factor [uncultured Roseobacter sp.]
MTGWLEASFTTQRPHAMAALTRYFRDIEIAEEVFAEACVKALVDWPENGPPRDPLAWLLTTARNAGLDRMRKAQRQKRLLAHHAADLEAVDQPAPDPDELRDDVLRLLFICCHPALERQDQIAVALKIVGGLTVGEIAQAFLIKPKTMEQRITRAKKRIADNPVAFETPSPEERGRRLGDVSLMIYLMFNEGWSTSGGDIQIRVTLCEEAIRLARLLVTLFPGMGEQVALLSLLLFQHARRNARTDADGKLVALEDQDRTRWDRSNIAEGSALLQKASRLNHLGPYRIQAAIAAEHARAASSEETDWLAIEAHYAALYAIQPTPVVRLNHIAAQARTKGAGFALAEMTPLADELDRYRWYHTMRASLLEQISDHTAAKEALERALELNPTEPECAVIREKISLCEKNLRTV